MSPSAITPSPATHTITTTTTTPTPIHKFPNTANTKEYALSLDSTDPLHHLRNQYIIPTKESLQSSTTNPLTTPVDQNATLEEQSVYFCGNSLGLQPKIMSEYIQAYLGVWSAIGVNGHFTEIDPSGSSPIKVTPWQNLAEKTAHQSARLVGAKPNEVAIMNSLSVNLHLLLAGFYKPDVAVGGGQRKKILLEWKAFPSDHYVVESQIRWHGLDPKECMILLKGDERNDEEGGYEHVISTEKILRVIDEQKDEIALVLLPGIQYYTGQLFDIEKITKFARERGIVVGWDLAHAAGNVELKLSEWDVDFAAWCTYKYMNAGPGSIAGVFVNEKHGRVEVDENGGVDFRPRLMGWYGGDKASRFKMDNKFRPIPGAGGYQVSNPSAIDLTSLTASLSVFDQTSMADLRQKSLKLTAYLQYLLLKDTPENDSERQFRIITPLDPSQRGAQLSVLLKPGLLKSVASTLKEAGIVADQREPDVVRVAPVPMYNTFHDVWYFVQQFKKALETQR